VGAKDNAIARRGRIEAGVRWSSVVLATPTSFAPFVGGLVMFQWLIMPSWAKRRARRQGALPHGQLEAAKFVLHKNKRYRATVVLSGFEVLASNDRVANEFTELGFRNAKVTGSGGTRLGEALWPTEDRSVAMPLDPHLRDVVELPEAAAA
jgi:hypothetical protein